MSSEKYGVLRAAPSATTPTMQLEIREAPIRNLDQHGDISIAFVVTSVLEAAPLEAVLLEGGRRVPVLRELPAPEPYVKDYDAIPGNHPADWSRCFDVTHWGLLAAYRDARRVGGAVIAFNTADLDLLEGDAQLAVLWDLRVDPQVRGKGVGTALFAAASRWAEARGCRRLKIETQNINVAACRFYAAQGCELGAIVRDAYPELPEEVQLLWYRNLSGQGET